MLRARSIFGRIKIKLLSRNFPKCRIESRRVSSEAALEENVRISHDVEVRANVHIGRWTYVEPYTFVNNADIGAFCAIGRNVAIGGFSHPYSYPTISPRLYREILGAQYDDSPPRVRIGSDVWIGEKAIILRGSVGDGSIIGAGSVVTKDVPPYAIVVGSPAKVIAYRFSDKEVRELLNLKWWNWPDNEILHNSEFFLAYEDWMKSTEG